VNTARIRIPSSIKRGQTFEVRVLIGHPMETGLRYDDDGKPIPRKIIRRFTCLYNGDVVVDADWHPAVAANPYVAFHARAAESGTLEFLWVDDDGSIGRDSASVTVT
jgi:sulfur-oxidizing protein SoxZ